MTQKRFYGIIIILLGGLFLISAVEPKFNAWEFIGTYWPLILILIGLTNLIGANGLRLSGLIITVIGVLFLLDTMDLEFLPFSTWDIVLPLLIIAIGFWLILNKGKDRINSKDYITQTVAFSGVEIACNFQNFKGADLFAAFGGIDIDLDAAKIVEDEIAKIDAVVAFGGVEILVPKNWNVTVTGIPLFGGWGNVTKKSTEETVAELKVHAFVIFGGLDIKYKEKN